MYFNFFTTSKHLGSELALDVFCNSVSNGRFFPLTSDAPGTRADHLPLGSGAKAGPLNVHCTALRLVGPAALFRQSQPRMCDPISLKDRMKRNVK